MTKTTPEIAPPSSKFRTTPPGGRLATTYDLDNRPNTWHIFIGFRAWNPPGAEAETLPLGYRGLLARLMSAIVKHVLTTVTLNEPHFTNTSRLEESPH
ncbi:hypothetical protein AVEN_58736-1 [Araneus ventricosus]|uniref:Uncharacterized protein n=1 Tax=Araneus ventricosus TaxID=182803 RepID=A0A4Y2R0L8_ARAVE|nr:hypothetical protein AVEN_265495-1 [Araneus ventricosus]GBN69176.1 hypothetical protein AVEN_58736-1 [Araneus ventricosus]